MKILSRVVSWAAVISLLLSMTLSAAAAGETPPLTAANPITVTNNAEGTDDTIVIGALSLNDTITIYSDSALTTPLLLTSQIYAPDTGVITITLPQLTSGDAAGDVYVTVTNDIAPESLPYTVAVPAAGISDAITSANTVKVTNNAVGKNDTVEVGGLTKGDKLNVYADAELTALLGSATTDAAGKAIISVPQITPNDSAGNVYATVITPGLKESLPYTVTVSSIGISAPLSDPTAIEAINNQQGISDTITVIGLLSGDVIKVYSDSGLTSLLGSATADDKGTAIVSAAQFVAYDAKGTVYLTRTQIGWQESTALAYTILSADASDKLTAANAVTVTNNAQGTKDTVMVSGLHSGDIIKVYTDDTLINLLGTATAAADGTALVTIPQITPNDATGIVYVTVTTSGHQESPGLTVTVSSAGAATGLTSSSNITYTSNAGTPDVLVISKLTPGDKIRVYSDVTMFNLLGSAVVTAAGIATITVAQMIYMDLQGDVYITVSSAGKLESAPFAVTFPAANGSTALSGVNTVTIINNAGINDKITITKLAQNDKVKIYADDRFITLLATATVGGTGIVTISVAQLTPNDAAGTIYITITNSNKSESAAVGVTVPAAKGSASLSSANVITAVNNASGTNDTITVTRLAQGDKIRIYSDSLLSDLLGSATAAVAGTVVAKIPQLVPFDVAGTVYITVANNAATESPAVSVDVLAAAVSDALSSHNTVTVSNNLTGTDDTIVITGLSQNDIIKVYTDDQLTSLVGTATAGAGGVATFKIAQLTANDVAGTAYVTITGTGELESSAVAVTIPAYSPSSPLSGFNTITVTNNFLGTSDTILITHLTQGDTVKVYSNSTLSVYLGSATATVSGPVLLSVPQLVPNDKAGTVYLTVTNAGKSESTAVSVSVLAATSTTALTAASSIFVSNNAVGTNDTIVVNGLAMNDVIKVYADVTLTRVIGSAKAAATGAATISVPQITPKDAAGTVFVTLTTPGQRESTAYPLLIPVVKNTAPLSGLGNVLVSSNAKGVNDTIVVNLLAPGDKVRVYADSAPAYLLGTATANADGIATVTVAQLIPNDITGTVYITLTNFGATESTPFPVVIPGANLTATLTDLTNVLVTNNALGTNDTIAVSGLVKGDKLKVYADSKLTALLGSTSADATGNATISVKQLITGDFGGTVYMTITNLGALESAGVDIPVPAAYITTALTATNILEVVNNALGTSDTVKVTNVIKGDKLKIYADSALTALLGSATAATTTATVSVPQLIVGDGSGTVYITVTNLGLKESIGYPLTVDAALQTVALADASAIDVKNYAKGTQDTVTVSTLSLGDKIKIYSDSKLTNLLGTGTATAKGIATINIAQLPGNDDIGTIYVTVTTGTLRASTALLKTFAAAPSTQPLTAASNIVITNFAVGTKDTVVIKGLAAGVKVKIYSDSKLTNCLSTAVVAATGTATISVPQLIANDAAGTIYITLTAPKSLESTAYAATVPKAGTSTGIK